MTDKPYHYVVVRTDLPGRVQVVQALHAAYEAGTELGRPRMNGNLVFLGVPSRLELTKLRAELYKQGVQYVAWRESDLGNEVTAIATAALYDSEERAVFEPLKLWRSKA